MAKFIRPIEFFSMTLGTLFVVGLGSLIN